MEAASPRGLPIGYSLRSLGGGHPVSFLRGACTIFWPRLERGRRRDTGVLGRQPWGQAWANPIEYRSGPLILGVTDGRTSDGIRSRSGSRVAGQRGLV